MHILIWFITISISQSIKIYAILFFRMAPAFSRTSRHSNWSFHVLASLSNSLRHTEMADGVTTYISDIWARLRFPLKDSIIVWSFSSGKHYTGALCNDWQRRLPSFGYILVTYCTRRGRLGHHYAFAVCNESWLWEK